ncbi:hypothetical protein DSO57_1010545 [Entomophthora muscae]|uniref:Uncharacterized protein n=1 Tax=Entomophthora muscae TaxID=34485 RepID=A0ACC2SVB7_9FUNG|nr:hypothetical protein DSO57_1010545 [Entomophthora muscae]
MKAGFRRGFSNQSHTLHSHKITLRNNLHQVFIDFKAAYDTVPMCQVLQTLTVCGAPLGLISLIISLFMNGGSKIVVNGALTLAVLKECGHRDPVQLQHALNVLSAWSHNNVVPSYTYLGFSQYPNDINFTQLTLEKCTKVTMSPTSIFGFADHWPAIARTSVQLNYRLSLLCLANSFAHSPVITQAIADLKALHKLALTWCIGFFQHTTQVSAITAIVEPVHQMTHLAIRFSKHIEYTASNNPICLICPWTTRGDVITRSCSDNFPGSLVNSKSFAMLACALPVLPIVCGQDALTLTYCFRAYH